MSNESFLQDRKADLKVGSVKIVSKTMACWGIIVFKIRGRKYIIPGNGGFPIYLGQEIVDFIVSLDDDEIETMARRVAQIQWYM